MVSDYIKNKISSASPDTLFFNRDFINFGARSAIDMCLSRMVIKGFLRRLCYGIYVRYDCEREYTATELGEAKAKRFDRVVTVHPIDTARQLKFTERRLIGKTFHAQGRTTSFRSPEGRIFYHATSSRRVALKHIDSGAAIDALWWLKRGVATEEHVLSVLQKMKRAEKEEFLWSHDLMPGWLSDLVHSACNWKIVFPLKNRA
ncbi:MAG: DUF6088 family protein [Candidatus Obscuribacterales bacterium]|nr:DUF6088 family protein [Candidatus Obscuribacterales bacterium]